MSGHPQGLVELSLHRFGVDASALELPVGAPMPESFSPSPAIGNQQPFCLYGLDECGAGLYRQAFGCLHLIIFNT